MLTRDTNVIAVPVVIVTEKGIFKIVCNLNNNFTKDVILGWSLDGLHVNCSSVQHLLGIQRSLGAAHRPSLRPPSPYQRRNQSSRCDC